MVVHSGAQPNCLEQVLEQVSIVVLGGIEEAVSLLSLLTKPFANESRVVLFSQLFTVLVKNLEGLELIGVTGEN